MSLFGLHRPSRRGRHDVGPAVTDLPSAAPVAPQPVLAVVEAVEPATEDVTAEPVPAEAVRAELAAEPVRADRRVGSVTAWPVAGRALHEVTPHRIASAPPAPDDRAPLRAVPDLPDLPDLSGPAVGAEPAAPALAAGPPREAVAVVPTPVAEAVAVEPAAVAEAVVVGPAVVEPEPTAAADSPAGPVTDPAVRRPSLVGRIGVPRRTLGTRIELGFRDGSTACLDPESDQARALDELARDLTRLA